VKVEEPDFFAFIEQFHKDHKSIDAAYTLKSEELYEQIKPLKD